MTTIGIRTPEWLRWPKTCITIGVVALKKRGGGKTVNGRRSTMSKNQVTYTSLKFCFQSMKFEFWFSLIYGQMTISFFIRNAKTFLNRNTSIKLTSGPFKSMTCYKVNILLICCQWRLSSILLQYGASVSSCLQMSIKQKVIFYCCYHFFK